MMCSYVLPIRLCSGRLVDAVGRQSSMLDKALCLIMLVLQNGRKGDQEMLPVQILCEEHSTP